MAFKLHPRPKVCYARHVTLSILKVPRRVLVAGFLFLGVLLWPTASNRRIIGDSADGEGLYRSSLTRANLGLSGIRLYESSQGKKHWNIESEFAELHRKENFAYLRSVLARFFAERTGNMITTRSNFGDARFDKQLIHLNGDVKVESKKGYLFTMPSLTYIGEKHAFLSDSAVQMRGPPASRPTIFLRGKGFSADIDREHFLLRKNVSGHKKLKGAEWLRVRSRSGEFFTNEQRSVFVGDVQSQLPRIVMESDTMEMALAEGDESILARGNVHLHNRGREGLAEYAFLKIGTNKVVLEGKAQVRSEDGTLLGRRITLYTDEDRIEVEGAEGRTN